MAYMAQQAVETATRDAFQDRDDVGDQAAEAARCLAWLRTLPLPEAMLSPVVEPVAAIEAGLRDADRLYRRRSAATGHPARRSADGS